MTANVDRYRAGAIRCSLVATGLEATDMLMAFIDAILRSKSRAERVETIHGHIEGRGDATWRGAALAVAIDVIER